MSRRLIATAAAVLACAIPFAASAALTKVSAEVTVDAELTPFGSFTGKSTSLNVADDGKELKFSVPVTSIKTGIGGRDEDMVKRFGNGSAVLTVPRDQVKFPTDKPTKGTVKGKLSLNKAETPVDVNYTAKKDGANIVVDADFSFDYKKHHVDPDGKRGEKACKIGICVAPTLKVKVAGAKFKE
jgi:polyisoprenoid-binding protein YceI